MARRPNRQPSLFPALAEGVPPAREGGASASGTRRAPGPGGNLHPGAKRRGRGLAEPLPRGDAESRSCLLPFREFGAAHLEGEGGGLGFIVGERGATHRQKVTLKQAPGDARVSTKGNTFSLVTETRSCLSRLASFVEEIGAGQHATRRRWIREMAFGMITARSPILAEIGRALEERCPSGQTRDLLYVEKRLSRGLNSDHLDDAVIRKNYGEWVKGRLPASGEGVVVAVDYTDISKPYAKFDGGMEGVCNCHDGSAGDTGLGYPVVQITAWQGARSFGLVNRPFSFRKDFVSQNAKFVEAFQEAAPLVGPRARWTLDRGFDSANILGELDRLDRRWVVRLQVSGSSQRTLVHPKLGSKRAGEWMRTLPLPWRVPFRRGKEIKIGSTIVQIADVEGAGGARFGTRERTLVVIEMPHGGRCAFLASEPDGTRAGAVAVREDYLRRWKAEEETRHAKDSRGWGLDLEDLRALKLRGVQRIALLVMLISSFLSDLAGAMGDQKGIKKALRALSFGELPDDLRYRFARWLGELLGDASDEDRARWRRGVV